MNADLITRALLAGILLCLALLVFQGTGGAGPQPGRFELEILSVRRGSPIVVRTDTATGRSWRLEGFPDAPRWIDMSEPGVAPAASSRPASDE